MFYGINNNAICFTYTSCYHYPNISGPLNQGIAWCFPLEPTLLLLLLPYPQQNPIWRYQLHIACSMKLIGSAWPPSRRFIRPPLNSFPFFSPSFLGPVFPVGRSSGCHLYELPLPWEVVVNAENTTGNDALPRPGITASCVQRKRLARNITQKHWTLP